MTDDLRLNMQEWVKPVRALYLKSYLDSLDRYAGGYRRVADAARKAARSFEALVEELERDR